MGSRQASDKICEIISFGKSGNIPSFSLLVDMMFSYKYLMEMEFIHRCKKAVDERGVGMLPRTDQVW